MTRHSEVNLGEKAGLESINLLVTVQGFTYDMSETDDNTTMKYTRTLGTFYSIYATLRSHKWDRKSMPTLLTFI